MNPMVRVIAIGALACSVGFPLTAIATNGYAPHGWGTRSKAMAGVATALPQDTLVTATNPAGMADIPTSLDLGVAFFSPSDRGYEANPDFSVDPGTGFPTGPFVTPGRYDSDRDWFVIPSFGYNHVLNDRFTVGIALFGNGGLDTTYRDRPVWENFAAAPDQLAIRPGIDPVPPGVVANASGLLFRITPAGPVPVTDPNATPEQGNANPGGILTATSPTGVHLEQLFFEFPLTYRFAGGKHAVGIAPIFALQRFEARGLEPFRAASVAPDAVTNNGSDWSHGFGLHLGWYGKIDDRLALGLSYRTKTWMTEFDDYRGLFAEGGDFDIPAMVNLGLAYRIEPRLIIGLDYQHIFYGDVDAIANSNDIDLMPCFGQNPKPSFCLGGDGGLGFGWEDMDIFKLGLRYDHSDNLSFMAGASYSTEFSAGSQALFNVLAPATIRWHLTLGASYRHSDADRFNVSFAYMPKEELSGTNPNITQSQTGSIFMEQMDIELSWSHRF